MLATEANDKVLPADRMQLSQTILHIFKRKKPKVKQFDGSDGRAETLYKNSVQVNIVLNT